MKVRQLKSITQQLIAVTGFTCLLAACNNSDESANNSTSPSGANPDTAVVANTNTGNVSGTGAKKKGKISANIAADDASMKIEKDNMGIYSRTEVAPVYTGGQDALDNYITNNIEYPQEAIDNNVEGTVKVQFAVDEKGNVSNVSTVGQKLGYGLEDEAVKVVSNMPKWTPGVVKGKKVKTWRTLPISYRLES